MIFCEAWESNSPISNAWRVCDPVSLESNVRGIYVAGVIVAGSRTNEIFIENGRFHGKQIADDLKRKLDV